MATACSSVRMARGFAAWWHNGDALDASILFARFFPARLYEIFMNGHTDGDILQVVTCTTSTESLIQVHEKVIFRTVHRPDTGQQKKNPIPCI